VKQSNLGEYDKNATEKKNIHVYKVKHQVPRKPSYMDGKHQFPPQISKVRSIEGFGENVGQLSLGVYVSHLYVSFLYMISQIVVSPLNMSHLFCVRLDFWLLR
jgi:hypothetical protein